MSFGERLRELRHSCGVNQRDLAERVGIDFTYLSKIENGHMPPPGEETILKLAEELKTDSDELLLLAGKVPEDLIPIITRSITIPKILRAIKALTDDQLHDLENHIDSLAKRYRSSPQGTRTK